METGRELGELALEWVKQGVPIFPCDTSKRPLTKNGHLDASVDPNTVLSMFEAAGERAVYIGAAMGRQSHLFAIDCDTYKEGITGEAAKKYENYLRQKNMLPETRTHKTVNGGVHYIFYSENDWPNCKPSAGVEVKGEGGYIIVPPSPGYEVIKKGLAVAPAELINELKLAKIAHSSQSISALKSLILSADSFHDALTSIAAKRANQGWEQERIQNELLNTLTASVARMPDHPRHSRWQQVIHNTQGELNRIVKSADKKYNSTSAADKLREAALTAGKLFDHQPKGNFEPETVKSPDEYAGAWPFEGGYFFAEEQKILDQKFIAYPIIAEGETTLIYADPKAGKTLLTHTLALHIAAGKPIGDKIWITEPRPVLYFALEGQVAIKRRQEAWKKQHPTVKDIPLFIHERPVNLTDDTTKEDLTNKIVAANNYFVNKGVAPIGAIIVDTLTKSMPGKDQNSVEDTSAVFDIIGRIRASGIHAAVIFVHHKNRSNTGPRGSGNIMAEPDTLLQLEKVNASQIKLTVSMARSIDDDFGAMVFNIESVDLGKSVQGFSIKAPILRVSNTPIISGEASRPSSDGLRDAKTNSTLLSRIITIGYGKHNLKNVHKHLLTEGIDPTIYPLAVKLRISNDRLLDYFKKLVPDGGRVFGPYAMTIEKSASGVYLNIKKVDLD